VRVEESTVRVGRTVRRCSSMSQVSRFGVGLAGAVVAASLSACGSDAGEEFADQSAAKIMDQAEKDTKSLKSLTLAGSITKGDGRLEIDLSADDGGDCAGTMGIGVGKAEVLRVDGASYIRGDDAFWRESAGESAAQVQALLGEKWAKLPAGDDDFSALCDVDKLFDDDLNDAKESYTKGTVATLGGKRAVQIIVKKEGEDPTNAWIATEGKHYLLKVEQKGGDEPGSFEMRDFNDPVNAEAPAEGEYVDLDNVG
jgi:hypothetical protein